MERFIVKSLRKKGNFECPNCGAVVRRGALACPECGSDERTGWNSEGDGDSGDFPTGYGKDADFNYEEFVRREFRGQGHADGSPTLLTKKNMIAAVSITLAVALIWLWVF